METVKKAKAKVGGHFDVTAYRNGAIIWQDRAENLVVNAGLDHMLDATLSGGTQITTWYVGLKGTGTPAAGDTIASHATWSEISDYTGDRKAWSDGGVSSQSLSNSASKASFAIDDTVTVYGAFLCSAETGTSGTLFCAGDFGTSKALENGDTLEVTYTISAADDGA